MNGNIGKVDRTVRVLLGLVLLAFALDFGFPETGWNWLGWIGLVPLLTALVRACPLYNIFGINTAL